MHFCWITLRYVERRKDYVKKRVSLVICTKFVLYSIIHEYEIELYVFIYLDDTVQLIKPINVNMQAGKKSFAAPISATNNATGITKSNTNSACKPLVTRILGSANVKTIQLQTGTKSGGHLGIGKPNANSKPLNVTRNIGLTNEVCSTAKITGGHLGIGKPKATSSNPLVTRVLGSTNVKAIQEQIGNTTLHAVPIGDCDTETVELAGVNSNSNITWPDNAVVCLFACYEDVHESQHANMNKKKDLWCEVSKKMAIDGYHYTAQNCDDKWRSLIKTYKRIVDSGKQTGNGGGKQWKFFDQMGDIIGKTASILPIRQSVLKQKGTSNKRSIIVVLVSLCKTYQ